jgi:hypothetical protein
MHNESFYLDLLLLLCIFSSFFRSEIGFASPTINRLARPRHRLQQHCFLIFFDDATGVTCDVTGMPAYVAPLRLHVHLYRVSARRRHHRSGGSTFDITIVVSASHVVDLINR